MYRKIFFNRHDLVAWVQEDGFVTVHRVSEHPASKAKVSEHVADKLPSQDWREVRLPGVPEPVRLDLVSAHKETTRLKRVVQGGLH